VGREVAKASALAESAGGDFTKALQAQKAADREQKEAAASAKSTAATKSKATPARSHKATPAKSHKATPAKSHKKKAADTIAEEEATVRLKKSHKRKPKEEEAEPDLPAKTPTASKTTKSPKAPETSAREDGAEASGKKGGSDSGSSGADSAERKEVTLKLKLKVPRRPGELRVSIRPVPKEALRQRAKLHAGFNKVQTDCQWILDRLVYALDEEGDSVCDGFGALPTRDELPEYYEVIKKPMDLEMVQRKIHKDQYKTVDAMAGDINLIVENCLLFNEPESDYYPAALTIRALMQDALRRHVSLLLSALPTRSHLKSLLLAHMHAAVAGC